MPAHPRSRGENVIVSVLADTKRGSSPLTRGKRDRIGSCRYEARLIPAHAGKTLCRGWHCHGRGAHPRSRGENSPCTTSWLIRLGSSPLTRGKRHEVRGQGCAAGLIPAHAGKTGRWRSRSGVWTAHPRSRGENGEVEIPEWRLDGSSPLTRGKRVERGANLIHIRLIPAHAGKTPSTCPADRRSRAHPRSRGENDEDASGGVGEAGSSPLTRGKRAPRTGGSCRGRLIPAHAGKTCRTFSTCSSLPAHPRSRGENSPSALPMMREAGSSPLTRGKQQRLDRGSVAPRLIPAHAGKTTRAVTRLRALSAHPRSRGEN